MPDKDNLEIKPHLEEKWKKLGGEYMMESQYALSIYVPQMSKTTALKKKKKKEWQQERLLKQTQLDNWETNSRTEVHKKLPTFSRLRLERKGTYSSQCV